MLQAAQLRVISSDLDPGHGSAIKHDSLGSHTGNKLEAGQELPPRCPTSLQGPRCQYPPWCPGAGAAMQWVSSHTAQLPLAKDTWPHLHSGQLLTGSTVLASAKCWARNPSYRFRANLVRFPKWSIKHLLSSHPLQPNGWLGGGVLYYFKLFFFFLIRSLCESLNWTWYCHVQQHFLNIVLNSTAGTQKCACVYVHNMLNTLLSEKKDAIYFKEGQRTSQK